MELKVTAPGISELARFMVNDDVFHFVINLKDDCTYLVDNYSKVFFRVSATGAELTDQRFDKPKILGRFRINTNKDTPDRWRDSFTWRFEPNESVELTCDIQRQDVLQVEESLLKKIMREILINDYDKVI